MTVHGRVSKPLENRRFKMPTNISPGTGDKNDIMEVPNNNDNVDMILTRNEDTNDRAVNCCQIILAAFDIGVDMVEIRICWDKFVIFQLTNKPR